MRKLLILIAISVFTSSSFTMMDNGIPKYLKKRMNKVFEELWPRESVTLTSIEINKELKNKIGNGCREASLFNITTGESDHKGYVFLAEVPSKYEYFDLLVIYKPDLSILISEVLIYREDYGAEICSQRWLRQFENKTSESKLQLDYDIQGISGATISTRAATNAIRKLTDALQSIHNDGALTTSAQISGKQ